MDFDIAAGIALITLFSLLAYRAGQRIGLRHPCRILSTQWLVTSLLLSLMSAWVLSGNLGWASLIPAASVLFLSNLTPVLLALAAGVAGASTSPVETRRPLVAAALLLLAFAYVVTPVTRRWLAPVHLSAKTDWKGDLCIQSHPSACAPAAAVSLLKMAGVDASERELADRCLTSVQGTEPLALFRGLVRSVSDLPIKARVASTSVDDWGRRSQLPNIALVRFQNNGSAHPLRQLLGPRGQGHVVVVFGQDASGNWLIGDPAFGRTKWDDEAFRSRFTGDAIYLLRQ